MLGGKCSCEGIQFCKQVETELIQMKYSQTESREIKYSSGAVIFISDSFYEFIIVSQCVITVFFVYLRWSKDYLSSVQLPSHVRLFATPWTAGCQASLSISNSQSLLKLMSIELVTPSNHLILSRPLLLLPSIIRSVRVFSNESVLCIR